MITTLRTNRLSIFILIGAASLIGGYQGVQARLAQPDVQRFVEAKAREILKAEVKIGEVRYLPPAQLSLQKIQMAPSETHPDFSIVQVDKLVLGYGLVNLIRRNFRVPDRVVMDSPRIQFAAGSAQTSVLDSSFSLSRLVPAALAIDDGEFRYPWGSEGKEWVLRKVRFKAEPDVRGQIRLELVSEMAGVSQGKIKVQGFVDPTFTHYELDVHLEDVTFLPESQIPLRKLNGVLRLSEKFIQTTGLTSFFHDWKVQWKGRIENWQTKPKLSFEAAHKEGKFPFRLAAEMDFESERVSGEWSWIGRSYPFRGKALREGKKVLFPSLEFPHGYTGEGEMDFSNGDYRIGVHQDRRRFQVHSNFSRMEFQTEFQLDHASINRLDWVVSGRARIVPLPKVSGKGPPRFKGWIETDYFIVEYEPLEDFKGSFELDSEGIQVIDARWGGVFLLDGRILFKGGKPREDLVLRVDGFPLASIRDFGGRPVPSNLAGELEGRLKFRGELARPEIQGYFTIKDGTIEKLDFDRAIIQFQGFPPYLKLYDSKIFRGRNTLKLLGAIDLGLENIFHGIQIKGPDHLVIWKGISASWKKGESAVQAEKPLSKKVSMGLEVGAGRNDSQGEDPDESHAVLGPKVRF